MCRLGRLVILTLILAGCSSLGSFVHFKNLLEKYIDVTGNIDKSLTLQN
jgi:hypothetical protein